MTAISSAIDLTRVSRAVGYKLKSGSFSPDTPYLPQRVVVLGEANTANQATATFETEFEFINAKEVADEFGYGSPLHQMARIIRPINGNPLGGIPTVIIAQEPDVAATAGIYVMGIAVAASVTANATHKIYINGRDGIDGQSYDINLVVGDAQADVQDKVVAAISSVISSPVVAAEATADVSLTTKWKGATAILAVTIDTQGEDAGVVYSEVSNTAGTGAVVLTDSLAFGEVWNTYVINPYGATQFSALETYNGIPDPTTPTGRYLSRNFKPFCALYGSLLSDKDDVIAVTNATARKTQVTNVHCPAPNSEGFAYEAAANMLVTWVPTAQSSPHLDNSAKQYPDMPVPSDSVIGDFSDDDARDFMVKRGSSTVNLVNGKYTVQDFVTTYVPDGVTLPKFNFVRILNISWNIAFKWILIMQRDIQDKTIVPDASPSVVADTVSPKQGNQLLRSHIQEVAELALIADTDFSNESIQVGINESNPARLDFFYRYKITSTAHIVSTDAEFDFNFSS